MEIEVGKFYRLRNGKKVKIAALDRPHPTYPIVGWDHTALLLSWTPAGISPSQPICDIVAEWSEPPPSEVFVNIYGSGSHLVNVAAHETHDGATQGASCFASAVAVRYVLATDDLLEGHSWQYEKHIRQNTPPV